jgi:hypothetical protein
MTAARRTRAILPLTRRTPLIQTNHFSHYTTDFWWFGARALRPTALTGFENDRFAQNLRKRPLLGRADR